MMAKALAANGAHKVYIVGRRKDKLEAAAASCASRNIIPLAGDVSSQESLRALAAHVEADVGYVNLLVANSGVSGPGGPKPDAGASIADFQRAILDVPMEEFTRCLHVNTTGVYYTAAAFLALLDAGNRAGGTAPAGVRSQIVATGSIAGFNRAVGAGWAYNASKAATHHLVKMLATNLVPWRIRCNALAPGRACCPPCFPGQRTSADLWARAVFPSEISAPLLQGKDATEEGAFDKNFIPAERTGDEQDMAGTLLYLASRAGAYVNGNVLVVDGGRLSILPSSY